MRGMAHNIPVSSKPTEVVEFTIGDEEQPYRFRLQKVASMILPVMESSNGSDGATQIQVTQRTWEWLQAGLQDDGYERLRARLADMSDPLDVGDLGDVVRWLVGKASGRPTSPRRG